MTLANEKFYVSRTFSLPATSKLTEEVIQQFDHLLECSTPQEYRNTLIEIYHTYICREHEALPCNFDKMAEQMYFLIDFLGRAGEEMGRK